MTNALSLCDEDALVRQWATGRRVHTRADEDGTVIVAGRDGSIWAYSAAELGISYLTAYDSPRRSARHWNTRRRRALAAGMRLLQNGDEEGSLAFDHGNAAQSRLALRLAGVKVKRRVTAAQRASLIARLQSATRPPEERGFAA